MKPIKGTLEKKVKTFPSSTYNMGDKESSDFDEPNPKHLYQPKATWPKRREDRLTSQSMIS